MVFQVTSSDIVAAVFGLLVSIYIYYRQKADSQQAAIDEQKDRDRLAKDQEVHESFSKMQAQLDAEKENRHAIELRLSEKVTQENLDKVYEKIDQTRQELHGEINNLSNQLSAFLNQKNGSAA